MYDRETEGGWLSYNLLPAWMQTNAQVMRDRMQQDTLNEISDTLNKIGAISLLEREESDRRHQEMIKNNQEMISSIHSGFGELANVFDFKMALLENVIETKSAQIKQTLDNIAKTLSSPIITKANELRDMAIERMKKGLLDKSLESFLKSYEMNDTDFFVNFQIGKIYLYGNIEGNNLIDLDKAEQFLQQALRYINTEEKGNINIESLKAEILLENAKVNLVKGNELYIKENKQLTEQVREKYNNVLNYTKEYFNAISEQKNEDIKQSAILLQAKANIYLNNKEKTLDLLSELLTNDVKNIYFLRKDNDFKNIIQDIENLFDNIYPKNEEAFFIKTIEAIKKGKTKNVKDIILTYINVTTIKALITKYKKIRKNKLLTDIINDEDIDKTFTQNKIINLILADDKPDNTEFLFEEYNELVESKLFDNILKDINETLLNGETKINSLLIKVYILILNNNILEAKRIIPEILKNDAIAYYILKNNEHFVSLKDYLEKEKKKLYFDNLVFIKP